MANMSPSVKVVLWSEKNAVVLLQHSFIEDLERCEVCVEEPFLASFLLGLVGGFVAIIMLCFKLQR